MGQETMRRLKVIRRLANQYPLENALQTFLVKTRKWEYEQEWRIVDLNDRTAVRYLPEGLVSRVIVGYNVSEDDRSEIRDLMERVHPAVPLAYAGLLPDEDTVVIRDEAGSGLVSS